MESSSKPLILDTAKCIRLYEQLIQTFPGLSISKRANIRNILYCLKLLLSKWSCWQLPLKKKLYAKEITHKFRNTLTNQEKYPQSDNTDYFTPFLWRITGGMNKKSNNKKNNLIINVTVRFNWCESQKHTALLIVSSQWTK